MKENTKSSNRLAGLLLTSHTSCWASGHGAPTDISPSRFRACHTLRGLGTHQAVRAALGALTSPQLTLLGVTVTARK